MNILSNNKVTITTLLEMKQNGEKISMLTAYDYPTAFFLEQANIDVILVGDSLGNVILGYESTSEVTIQDIIHHANAVKKGVNNTFMLVDVPLQAFSSDVQSSISNITKIYYATKADALKVEVTSITRDLIPLLVKDNIPIMAHLGLTPQLYTDTKDMKIQGRSLDEAYRIIDLALELEKEGCFSLLLECIPEEIAHIITSKVGVPVIGCGAGSLCDGQVLVTHDILGLYPRKVPRFAKVYSDLSKEFKNIFTKYIDDVKKMVFPSKENTYHLDEEIVIQLQKRYFP